jgi:hypothetical protein
MALKARARVQILAPQARCRTLGGEVDRKLYRCARNMVRDFVGDRVHQYANPRQAP